MKASQTLRRALNRMSLRGQMLAAFALILLLTAAVGASSLYGMQQVDANTRQLADKWMVGVGHVADSRTVLIETREFEMKHSRTTDKSYHAEYEQKMVDGAKNLGAHLAAYESRIDGADEATLFAALRKALTAYQTSQQRVVSLGREQKQQDAVEISDGASSMGFDDAIAALSALTRYNFDGGAAAAQQAAAMYVQARWVEMGLLAAALVLGVGLALGLAGQVLSQLGGEPATAVKLAKAVAEGDLSTPIRLATGDTSSVMAWLQAMQVGLARAVSEVRQGSEHLAIASAEIADGNQDLSARTEQQAGALQQAASTMEELNGTVSANADSARQASTLAQGASSVARRGGDVVSEVVSTMKSINEGSRQIAEITGVIDSIAFQTNILALNAAVEAARAGEQGRGFAVVASEVRSLAQRSAEAARTIKTLIGASEAKVEAGTQLVDRAGHTMVEIVNSIRQVEQIVAEISTASEAQSRGIAAVGQAVSQMDRSTQQNAALVEQSAAAADSLKSQAAQLVQAVAVFRLAAAAQ